MGPVEAAGWGALAASTLVFGALIAIARPVAERRLGLIMAFGSGVLVSSVAYQLTEDAVAVGGQLPMALGLGVGALVFYLGDRAIDRQGGAGMGSTRGPDQPESGPAIVLGAALDGIPESIVLGLTISAGASVGFAFFLAVLFANLPEGIAGTSGLRARGWAPAGILRLWLVVVGASALGAVVGAMVLAGGGGEIHAFILGFAGGAILTMLADSFIPDAFKHAGKPAGLATTLGFGVAFALTLLDRLPA